MEGGCGGNPQKDVPSSDGSCWRPKVQLARADRLCVWRQSDSNIVSLLVLAAATTIPSPPNPQHWIWGPCLLPCAISVSVKREGASAFIFRLGWVKQGIKRNKGWWRCSGRNSKHILASGPWATVPGLWSCGGYWQEWSLGHPLPYSHPEQPETHAGPLGRIGTFVLG